MRTCDADAMIKDRYGNQLQITHEAEVKVSLRPALVTMSRNSGGRLNFLSGLASHRTYPSHRSPQGSKKHRQPPSPNTSTGLVHKSLIGLNVQMLREPAYQPRPPMGCNRQKFPSARTNPCASGETKNKPH